MHDPIFLAGKSEVATKEDLQVAQDLLDTLMAHREGCVGMAANMIGVRKRIIAFLDESGRASTYTVNGIGVHVYEVQSCFTAPSTGASALSAGTSAWIVDTLTLRSGKELLEIFRIAAVERK
mgnify:CR=1 FL=1